MRCLSCLGKGCSVCVYTGRFINNQFIDTNERYTPAFLVDAARRCMGCIDCDPASCEEANKVVRATRYYTYKDNGLKQEWYGNVWCNPPYGLVPGFDKGLQDLFIDKAVDSVENGYVEQMILLLNGQSVYNPYFNGLWKYPICFYQGRINFKDYQGKIRRGRGNVIVYLGRNVNGFVREFLQFGPIATVVTGYQEYAYTNKLDIALEI